MGRLVDRTPRLLRVAIAVDAPAPEWIELAIASWESVGVRNSSVEYLLDETSEEPWPGHDNRSDRAEVVAYLTEDRWAQLEAPTQDALRSLLGQPATIQVRKLPSRDWRTAWHDHFNIVRVPVPDRARDSLRSITPDGPMATTIIVRPPHISYQAKPGEIVIDLVPGLAFGTGQHQSTRLCLGLLAGTIVRGEQVLDVGSGSGILAVAAVKLGAASVLATDIDPVAVDAARQTARQNQLDARIEVREASIPEGERFDLVVANLTADLLQYLAGELARSLRPGGRLIVSGLIAPRQEEVEAAFSAYGLGLEAVRLEDEWRALLLSSPSQ